MRTLDQIGLERGTDKNSRWHNYLDSYAMFFESRRGEALNVLEIGVLNGASLLMWEEYFPNANIVGMDILDRKQFETTRTKIVMADQSNTEQLKSVMTGLPRMDIVIDDGSHRSSHMILTFEVLFPLLASGGLYCIEDILTGYHPDFYSPGRSIIDYIKTLIDAVQVHGTIPDMCSDKAKFNRNHQADYLDMNVHWMWTGCGLVIVKKI